MMTQNEINSWITFLSSLDVDYSCTVLLHRGFSNSKRTENFKEDVRRLLKIFIRQLNIHFYGTKSTKTKDKYMGPKLTIVPVMENWNLSTDLHFHLHIGNVPIDDMNEITQRIKHSWEKVPMSESKSNSCLVEKTWDKTGWNKYITKELYSKNSDCVITDLIQTTC
jgi:hypothetical protein